MTPNVVTTRQRRPDAVAMLAAVPGPSPHAQGTDRQEGRMVHVGHGQDCGRRQRGPSMRSQSGQLIFVASGRGVLRLESGAISFEGPCVLLLPAGCAHDLDYPTGAERWTVTVQAACLAQVKGKLPALMRLWAGPGMIALSYQDNAAAEFYSVLRQLEREVASRAIGHVAGTEALLTTLLMLLVRSLQRDQGVADGASGGALRLADRFRELIDLQCRNKLSLSDYASLLAVSPTQLRAACAAVSGQSPTRMIHARMITEARRDLVLGDASIERIAFSLGFSDAAYFARFFRKQVGQTPSQFRVDARGLVAAETVSV